MVGPGSFSKNSKKYPLNKNFSMSGLAFRSNPRITCRNVSPLLEPSHFPFDPHFLLRIHCHTSCV